jgi:SAM-dependent methyltransferase
MRKPSKSFDGSGTEEYYDRRIEEHGYDSKSFWNSREAQFERFRVLSEVGNLNGCSVLDVGCGAGHLLDFFAEKRISPRGYLGCDLSAKAVRLAQSHHPDFKFWKGNILDLEVDRSFDYALGSGLFALNCDGWHRNVRDVVQRMFDLSVSGVAVNFLSYFRGPSLNRESKFADPSAVLYLLMRRITSKIVLRHDYRGNDFTIYLYN